MRLTSASSARARALVAQRLGLACPDHRLTDLEAAVLEATRRARLRSPDALLAHLSALPDDAPEWSRLAERLTIGETYFFRDRAVFDALERHVLPALIAARSAQEEPWSLSVWSAGCSTGEEAYSLAMLLDQLLPDTETWKRTILGTDVNPASLQVARRGVYRPWSLRDTPDVLRDRYFLRRKGAYEVVAEIRRHVQFASLNLAADGLPAAGVAVDLLLCRNVLMYLSRAAAGRAIGRLRAALAPDGWLVVAGAESWAESFRPLVPVNFPGTILFTSEASARRHGLLTPLRPVAGSAARRLPPDRPVPPAPSPAAATARIAEPPTQEPSAPRSAVEMLSAARLLADRGELDEALRLCQAVVKRDRLDPAGHRLLAAIHQERGDFGEALAALRRALYLDPDCAEAHAALGHLLLRRGENRRARRHLETASRLGHGRGDVS